MNHHKLTLALLLLMPVFAQAAQTGLQAPQHLRCEHKPNPLGLDTPEPRLSWWVTDDRPNAVQSAYQVEVYTDESGQTLKWNTGKVESDESVGIVYAGPELGTGERLHWRVRTWDSHDEASPWSEMAWFEMALMEPNDWRAAWIGHPPRFTNRPQPAVYLREDLNLGASIKRARLYISARGIFEAQINGQPVSEDVFAPGWTDYSLRNQYMTYDVTSLLQEGENAVGLILADGWHNGNLKWAGSRNWYGDDTSVIAQMVIDLDGGERVFLATGSEWRVATGPIVESDFYNGEKYDARSELGDWSMPGYDESKWLAPRLEDADTGMLVAKVIQPVRRQEVLPAQSIRRADNGEWIFDFGQNIVGWTRLRARGKLGGSVQLRFAEMLNPDGTLYVDNLRSAEAVDRYTFAAKGREEEGWNRKFHGNYEEWEPKFTFHGFRYAGITGLDYEPDAETLEAVVLNTDAPMTGEFECSNPLLNRLQSNIVWGQKGNYLEVPTDCPQRDERLGWTGDAQVFVRTATFNMEIQPFFEKWMADMRDAQQPNGQVPVIIPRLDDKGSSPAWSDAVTICPWTIYDRYGNERILAENLGAMADWVDYQESSSDDLIWPSKDAWGGFGDWLAIDAPTPGEAPTPKNLIGTAHFANSATLTAKAAEVVGDTNRAQHYRDLAERVRQAFRKEFVNRDGTLKKETQTGYLLALAFDMLEENQREKAVERLIADIESRGWHLSTGFVGTGLLMPTLSEVGRNDVAYRILMQETYPGWLYSIRQGATTMWERWNSYTHEDGFGPVSMNSFNHYAYGAVGEWMYSVIGGIDNIEPGFKKIRIRPLPGGGLNSARASLESPYGLISTSWNVKGQGFKLEATIPPNTTAVVELPDGKRHEVGSGHHSFHAELK